MEKHSPWVGAIHFDPWDFSRVVGFILNPNDVCESSSHSHPGTAIHFANAYNVALAETDNAYRRLLFDTDHVFIDGTPVVWAARVTRRNINGTWTRIYGPAVMRAVLAGSTDSHRHFLLGGTRQVLNRLQDAIAHSYPEARIVGTYSPPFGENIDRVELDVRDKKIDEANPTHIWVGLGTPKQDYEVVRLARKHQAKSLAIGAAFDFLSGSTKEAPNIIQALGLQWLHRLSKEPRRLAKRYAWGNPVFILSLLRWRHSPPQVHQSRRFGPRNPTGPADSSICDVGPQN